MHIVQKKKKNKTGKKLEGKNNIKTYCVYLRIIFFMQKIFRINCNFDYNTKWLQKDRICPK